MNGKNALLPWTSATLPSPHKTREYRVFRQTKPVLYAQNRTYLIERQNPVLGVFRTRTSPLSAAFPSHCSESQPGDLEDSRSQPSSTRDTNDLVRANKITHDI